MLAFLPLVCYDYSVNLSAFLGSTVERQERKNQRRSPIGFTEKCHETP